MNVYETEEELAQHIIDLREAAREVLDHAHGLTLPTEMTLALHRLSRLTRLADSNWCKRL